MRSLRSFFASRSYSVRRASALLAITALLSNVLGLLRNVVFYRFVPPEQLDIYYASFRIPDLIFNILILGAISSAFIPLLGELLDKDRKEDAWKLTNQVISWLTVVFGALAVGLFFAMPSIMPYIVPGFEAARLEQAVLISRILLLQGVFFAWSWTFGGLLNSFNRFSSYAFAPLLYNAVIIVGGFLATRYGIIAIAWSVVVGAIGHMLIQFRETRLIGYRPHFSLAWTKELREILSLMLPRSFSQGMNQLVLIVFTTLASTLTAGSIAIFSGMNDLQTTPIVIVANSLAVAFFPTLTKYAAGEEWEEVNKLTTKVVRGALYLLVPSIALAYILRAQLVRLYFGIGGAGWDLTTLAIDTFSWFLVGIIPAALVTILARVFYGFKDTRTPFILNSLGSLVGIGTALVAIGLEGGTVADLAMAVAVAAWAQCLLYVGFLYKTGRFHLGFVELGKMLLSFAFGGLLAAFVAWGTLYSIDRLYEVYVPLQTSTILGLFIQFLVAGVTGVTTYAGYSMVVHKEELAWLKASVLSKRQ